MKLYAVIQKNTLRATDFEPRILGITKYPKDAKIYAALHNDFERRQYGKSAVYTSLDGYELCEVEEFDSNDLNAITDEVPKIWYRLLFEIDGEMIDIWNDGYTFIDYSEVRYDVTPDGDFENRRVKTVIYVQMTVDSNIPESAIIEIAKEKVKKFIEENAKGNANEN